jgi:hypothetical protein
MNLNTILGRCIKRDDLAGRRVRRDGDCSEREDGEDELAEMYCEFGVQPKDDESKRAGRPFISSVAPINS